TRRFISALYAAIVVANAGLIIGAGGSGIGTPPVASLSRYGGRLAVRLAASTDNRSVCPCLPGREAEPARPLVAFPAACGTLQTADQSLGGVRVMKVIIVGAGVGGLVTALMLHARGIDCEIFEQADAVRELGVGINTLPHAIKELAGLGLLERLHAVAIPTYQLF